MTEAELSGKGYTNRGNIMHEQKNTQREFLAIQTTSGQKRGMMDIDNPPEKFVNYHEIKIPEHKVRYLIYKYYPNDAVGHAESSCFYENYQIFQGSLDRLKRIPTEYSDEEIDKRIYRTMRAFGSIQKIDEHEKRYNLEEKMFCTGFFAESRLVSTPTQNDPLKLSPAPSSCAIL